MVRTLSLLPLLPVLLTLSACDSGTVKIGGDTVGADPGGSDDTGSTDSGDSGTGDSTADTGDSGADTSTGDSGTGDSGTGDSGTGDSGSTDTGTTDTGTTDTGTTAEPEPDYSVWAGTRTFSYSADWGDCDETVTESGAALSSGDTYDALVSACPSCDYVYEVDISTDTVCDWIRLTNPTYRGLVLGSGTAAVYSFSQNWDGSLSLTTLDDSASFDGWNLDYAYEIDYGATIDVAGAVAFPELSP